MDLSRALSNTFMFSGLSVEQISELIRELSLEKKAFTKGEIIYSPEFFDNKIGFVLEGVCEVRRKKSDGGFFPLNKIESNGSFGILACFSVDEYFPTYIYAKKDCKIVFINKDDVISLVKKDSTVALNIIKFMSDRISFLNNKISSFSADNIEQKLSNLIISQYRSSGQAVIDFNKKQTAEKMNVGRATLYRGLRSLCESGLIKIDSKKIYITDPIGLERISK